ncbi:uncharacterized protein LOC128203560 [Mya arenaria]|uniref:uncharacterized protein LOC128203560 n=1 Tax=Mya arenaria TaxID=6604 RepID=UPI0022DF4D51|nr:uncharacterized protein LOC128203560 [Mya arenaria]
MRAGAVGRGVKEPRDLGQRSSYIWKMMPDGRVQRSTGHWVISSQSCHTIRDFWPRGSCDKANFHRIGSPKPGQKVPMRQSEVLISCDPENYLIRVACEPADLAPGSPCLQGAAQILIRDRREDSDGDGFFDENPDYSGTDWCKIDRLIEACMHTKLVDWQWHPYRREECERP